MCLGSRNREGFGDEMKEKETESRLGNDVDVLSKAEEGKNRSRERRRGEKKEGIE